MIRLIIKVVLYIILHRHDELCIFFLNEDEIEHYGLLENDIKKCHFDIYEGNEKL